MGMGLTPKGSQPVFRVSDRSGTRITEWKTFDVKRKSRKKYK